MLPSAHYQQLVDENRVSDDPRQREILTALDALHRQLQAPSMPLLGRLWGRKTQPAQGIYLWGSVGRGKSMLMDLLFHSLTLPKQRLHFHAFMRKIHAGLHEQRQSRAEDPLLPVADAFARRMKLLYLDEFEVHDVADAMLLSSLFGRLLERGVVCIFTSNRPPEGHYQHGLQRDRYLRFVEELKQQVQVLTLDAPTDYRLQKLKALRQTWWSPLNAAGTEWLDACFHELSDGFADKVELEVLGRHLSFDTAAGNVLKTSFHQLCHKELGSADYLALANRFDTILLGGIPLLGPENRNEARRFVTLIDILYQQKVKLIATAAAQAEALYPEGDGAFEFKRTVSRLNEMQSGGYLEQVHERMDNAA